MLFRSLVNSTDAITVMRDALDARKSRLSGGRMTKETQSTTVSATASQADVTDVVPATEGENATLLLLAELHLQSMPRLW